MQNLKPKFSRPDGTTDGSLQSCVRTNDLDLVGDGTHLTYFEMLGNFSFGKVPYDASIELWTAILDDLKLREGSVIHVHPDSKHRSLWESRGWKVINDEECKWSDGAIGGYCSEVYWRGVEIGNLVNTLETMTDVGFGFERLIAAIEGKPRVDECSLFDTSLSYVERDHVRALDSFWLNGVAPGNKSRNYVCRKLLRRVFGLLGKPYAWKDWLSSEHALWTKALERGKKAWRKNRDKSEQWWWETFGLTKEDTATFG